jgi:polyhydroxyalkanoate synthesis regulator phasin
MYTDELKQIQGIFNNAIESEQRVQKFIQDKLKEKYKISQDDIIFIEEAMKYETAEQFKTAPMSKEIQDEFYKKYGHLTLEEAKAKADEIFKYSRLLTKD